MIFHKNYYFLIEIGPLWAHRALYGEAHPKITKCCWEEQLGDVILNKLSSCTDVLANDLCAHTDEGNQGIATFCRSTCGLGGDDDPGWDLESERRKWLLWRARDQYIKTYLVFLLKEDRLLTIDRNERFTQVYQTPASTSMYSLREEYELSLIHI